MSEMVILLSHTSEIDASFLNILQYEVMCMYKLASFHVHTTCSLRLHLWCPINLGIYFTL
jgi:hypothetical protein